MRQLSRNIRSQHSSVQKTTARKMSPKLLKMSEFFGDRPSLLKIVAPSISGPNTTGFISLRGFRKENV
jgi:hypothetical protein